MFKVKQHEARALSWWYAERESIDLDPVYQRRSDVWSEGDKAFLIDSILNDFDIPKVYLADFTYRDTPLNKDGKAYAVIDGKQRLGAIFDFFDGRLALGETFTYLAEPSLDLAGLTYRDLKSHYPKVASKFENYNLTVMSVITDEKTKINELFVRLNRSKPLTGAEVRNAMGGIVPQLIRLLAGHVFFQSRIRFSTQRRQEYNAAAKILLIEFREHFVDTKRTQLDRFVEDALLMETADYGSAVDRAQSVLNAMADVFAPRDVLLASSGPVPLYYWLVRACDHQNRGRIREFLLAFERKRQKNRKLAQDGGPGVDEELLAYDVANRSPDDHRSLSRRYDILMHRFRAFLAEELPG